MLLPVQRGSKPPIAPEFYAFLTWPGARARSKRAQIAARMMAASRFAMLCRLGNNRERTRGKRARKKKDIYCSTTRRTRQQWWLPRLSCCSDAPSRANKHKQRCSQSGKERISTLSKHLQLCIDSHSVTPHSEPRETTQPMPQISPPRYAKHLENVVWVRTTKQAPRCQDHGRVSERQLL